MTYPTSPPPVRGIVNGIGFTGLLVFVIYFLYRVFAEVVS